MPEQATTNTDSDAASQANNASVASADRPGRTPSAKRQLRAAVSLFSTVIVSCCLLMWSVFNIWTNVLMYRASELEGQNWKVTLGMVVITCVVPLAIGLVLLFKSLGSPQK